MIFLNLYQVKKTIKMNKGTRMAIQVDYPDEGLVLSLALI